MEQSKEYVLDFQRIFFGNLPWLFLVEIMLRTLVIYVTRCASCACSASGAWASSRRSTS